MTMRPRKLKLPKAEDLDFELKLTAGAIENKDLVAFANSPSGGVIIVGVREDRRKKVFDENDIEGCDCGDSEKQRILGKARSCIPPINVDIEVRKHKKLTCFWVTIPSSQMKPHCTGGGTYSIRGDGTTNPLAPMQLLELLVNREGDVFLKRFGEATQSLTTDVDKLKGKLESQFNDLRERVSWFEGQVEASLEGIASNASDASSFADETLSAVHATLDCASEINERTAQTEWEFAAIQSKLNALIGALLTSRPALKLLEPDIRLLIERKLLSYGKSRKLPKTKRKEILADLSASLDYIPSEFLEEVYDGYVGRHGVI